MNKLTTTIFSLQKDVNELRNDDAFKCDYAMRIILRCWYTDLTSARTESLLIEKNLESALSDKTDYETKIHNLDLEIIRLNAELRDLIENDCLSRPVTIETDAIVNRTVENTMSSRNRFINLLTKDERDSFVKVQKLGQFLTALTDNKMITAIKLYREAFGSGLRDSKNAVDEIRRRFEKNYNVEWTNSGWKTKTNASFKE